MMHLHSPKTSMVKEGPGLQPPAAKSMLPLAPFVSKRQSWQTKTTGGRKLSMRTYIFVDAENHFLRSTAAAKDIIGSEKAPQALCRVDFYHHGEAFPRVIDGKRFAWNPDLQLFWDCNHVMKVPVPSFHIERAVYVGSCSGGEDVVHAMRTKIREYGFEPIVIREIKDTMLNRQQLLKTDAIMEKPKGCDIALATRMVADAAANLYDACFLFTTDADFLPAVEAVRRLGKRVYVFGYGSNLRKRSEYLFVPDQFINLERHLAHAWHDERHKIETALRDMGEEGPFKPRVEPKDWPK